MASNNVFVNLFSEGNEKNLYNKCADYYRHLQAYADKHQTPVPEEMAQKLGLRLEEYSELLSFIADGGMDAVMGTMVARDFEDGATNLPDNLQF